MVGGRPTRAWDLDRALKSTSEQVLVTWLISDDNYTRWQSASCQGPVTRVDLCDEINDLLHAQRIYHRTDSAISRKIEYVEQSVRKARTLLVSHGIHRTDTLQHCGEHLRRVILERCPHFEVLAPVFTAQTQQSSSPEANQSLRPRLKVRRRQDEESCSSDDEAGDESNEEEDDDPVSLLSRRPPKAAKGSSSRSFKKKLQFLTWHTDHVRDQSSLDVLLSWLTDKSNYARWKRSCQPTSAKSSAVVCTEIRNLMRAQGIEHRSNAGIRRKILLLEDMMARAIKFLAGQGLRGLTTLGDCEQAVKTKVLRICPEFERLAPVMVNDRERHEPESPSEAQQRRPVTPIITQRTKRARDLSADTEDSAYSSSPHSFMSPKRRVVTPPSRHNSDLDRVFQRRRASHEMEVEIRQGWIQLEREKRKLELKAAQKKIDLELRVVQEQQEAALVVVRALARLKLLNAGLPCEEVDALLPRKHFRE